MEEQIFDVLVCQNEVGWKAIIYDLMREEGMDPWDVNVALLSKKYLAKIKELKEADLYVSGKVILAAAILLKMKSHKLVGDDLLEFDRMLAHPQSEDEFYEEYGQDVRHKRIFAGSNEEFPLYPRTPQPRKRKVSVFDLLSALDKAMEVKQRRVNRLEAVAMAPHEKKMDIGKILKDLFLKLCDIFRRKQSVDFDELVDMSSRDDIVNTFIPLLYLSNEQKVLLHQDVPFGKITILSPQEEAGA